MIITIISFDNWGFNKHLAQTLHENGHQINHIDFSKFKYKYPNFLYRIYNFILKTFLNQNIKTKFYGKKVIEELESLNSKQDLILTIKADFIAPEFAKKIKDHSDKSIAFFNDNIKRCPKILKVINCFDEVYSFEKEDCQKHNLKFKTNFIYNFIPSNAISKSAKYKMFNISSYGKRSSFILKIAKILNTENIPNKIIILDKKRKLKDSKYVEVIKQPKNLEELSILMNESETLLDIHRDNQSGLSFRVFESLGLQKKLITTNSDIVNYDFYNPNNILVIDSEKPEIPADFFNHTYQNIPESIFNQYKIMGWFSEFLK